MNQKYFAFLGRFEGPISQAEIRSVRNQAKWSDQLAASLVQ